MDYDAAWCPVCDRQIIPKRFQVPIPPPPPPPPPVIPSPVGQVRRTKGGTIKRASHQRPSQPSRRADSTQSSPQPDTPKPAHPTKFRTVIDQNPIPLYCSEECRFADLHNHNRGLPLNPDRDACFVPVKTFTATSETESDSTVSSIDSMSSTSSSSASDQSHLSPSMATLAAMYKFPPPPPRPPIFEESSSSDSEYYSHDYSSGIMMAGRFIDSVCPKPAKRSPYTFSQPPEPRKPVPGWSDGSNAWRSSVYSFSSPRKARDPLSADEASKAYRSFTASPHRSCGIHSTLGDSAESTPRNFSSAGSLPTAAQELIQKYSQSFNRRSESRSSAHSGSVPTSPTSAHSFPATMSTSQRRERSIVKRGAEGKLLVPDVKLKVHSGSSTSLSSAWSGSVLGSRKSVHSPLSVTSGDSSDDESRLGTSNVTARRPVVETRSWSYDNFKTYPIMQLPSRKEKQLQKQIIDGQEVQVEVEVEVEPTLKRLFLFSPTVRQA